MFDFPKTRPHTRCVDQKLPCMVAWQFRQANVQLRHISLQHGAGELIPDIEGHEDRLGCVPRPILDVCAPVANAVHLSVAPDEKDPMRLIMYR